MQVVADDSSGVNPIVYVSDRDPPYELTDIIDRDNNVCTDGVEELLRSLAKLLLYVDLLEDDANAQRMATKIPVLLDGLRSETSARLGTGRIKGTEF
jgi:hypothetical protein